MEICDGSALINLESAAEDRGRLRRNLAAIIINWIDNAVMAALGVVIARSSIGREDILVSSCCIAEDYLIVLPCLIMSNFLVYIAIPEDVRRF